MVGVTHIPDVYKIRLKPENKYLVLCSDGVSQFISDAAILQEVHSAYQAGLPPQIVARNLCTWAAQEWMKFDTCIDDCTAVVIYLSVDEERTEDKVRQCIKQRARDL